jgi:hypothetical protein
MTTGGFVVLGLGEKQTLNGGRRRRRMRRREDEVTNTQIRSQIATHHVTRNNTPIHNIHNILSTAQLSISQKALGTLPEDGNVMPKQVGATIHN